jgi:hypothetical protein
VVECGGLENRCGCKLTVGSNPTPSADFQRRNSDGTARQARCIGYVRLAVIACLLLTACDPSSVGPADASTLPPDWSVREAAGMRIAAPTAWLGPEVLPAHDSTAGPIWVVFKDRSGAETLTFMTWRDTTASALAKRQFDSERPQGDLQNVTLSEGNRTRAAVAVTAHAGWYDANGSGSYQCRHLFVQVAPTLVADVIACGAHVRGTSTPAPDLLRAQDQVALRLGVAGGQP